MSEAVSVMVTWFDEVWNKGRVEAIDELLAEPCRVTGLGEPITSCQGFKEYHKAMNSFFEDIHVEVDRVVSYGVDLCGQFTFKAIHRASGKPIEVHGSWFGTVKDGKILEAENRVDFVPLLTALGLIPEDAIEKALLGEKLF